jgi:hypothetical protein
MSDLLNAALAYLKRGLSIIPIQPREKKPLIHWEQCQKQLATGKRSSDGGQSGRTQMLVS